MKHLVNKAGILSLIILAISFLGCEEDDESGLPSVVALFTQTQIENTGVVTFINLSENANTFLWDFGDGTEVITWPEAVANHTYMTEGNYTALVMAHTDVSHVNDTVSYIMFP